MKESLNNFRESMCFPSYFLNNCQFTIVISNSAFSCKIRSRRIKPWKSWSSKWHSGWFTTDTLWCREITRRRKGSRQAHVSQNLGLFVIYPYSISRFLLYSARNNFLKKMQKKDKNAKKVCKKGLLILLMVGLRMKRILKVVMIIYLLGILLLMILDCISYARIRKFSSSFSSKISSFHEAGSTKNWKISCTEKLVVCFWYLSEFENNVFLLHKKQNKTFLQNNLFSNSDICKKDDYDNIRSPKDQRQTRMPTRFQTRKQSRRATRLVGIAATRLG